MRQIAIGTVLAAVILVLGALVPRLLRGEQAKVEQAETQAVLAARRLSAYDPRMELIPLRVDPAALRQADVEALYKQASEAFGELSKQLSAIVRRARQSDQQTGLKPATALPAGTLNAATVRRAAQELDKLLSANRKLLTEAARRAREAMQAAGDADVPGLAVGSARTSEATAHLATAQFRRARLAAARTETVLLAARAAELSARRLGTQSRDLGPLREALKQQQEDLSAQLAEHQRQIAELEQQIRQRRQRLAGLEQQIRQLDARRRALLDAGFAPGDDAAFEAYREQLAQLTAQLQQMQREQALLRDGGVRGARLPDDLIRGTIEGGEPVQPLAWLESQLALHRDAAGRLETALKSIADQLRRLDGLEQNNATRSEALGKELAALREQIEKAWQRALELRTQAIQDEDKALSAARDAASAFDRARRAVENWQRQARDAQQQFDPERKNERLRQILADRMAEVLARASRAQALIIAARVAALRATSDQRLAQAAERIGHLVDGLSWDVSEIQKAADEARGTGVEQLGKAQQELTKARQRADVAQWVFDAQLAVVHVLLAELDPSNAAQHRSDAVEALRSAIEGREQAPYVQPFVRFYAHLTGGQSSAAPPQTPETRAEPPTP